MTVESKNLDKELLRIGETNSPVVISLSHFNGMRGVDVRKHYYDKKTGETKPTAKGIWLKEDEFLAISQLFTSQLSLIVSFFKTDLSSSELNNRSRLLEQEARRASVNDDGDLTYSVEEWPGTKFFNYTNQGNQHHIALNSRHEIFKEISVESSGLVARILYAYIKARNQIDIKSTEQIMNLVEAEWGNQVNKIVV